MLKMVTFHTKANPQGQYYLPKEVRQELGEQIDLICNTKAAVIYDSNIPLDLVLKSLKILCNDVENRLEMEKRETNKMKETSTNFQKGGN
jgi:bifunctional DNA-binding transcriptional regulator/antitoxin component of YhaV-PrlF toxin-antitoxin module